MKSSSAKKKGGKGKKLVVVESPAKARTINRYLGNDYVVKASMGHVRDLPKRNPKGVKSDVPGVDVEHDFEPTYIPLTRGKKNLAELKKLAKEAPQVYLATDLDREGEAIAWHLFEALKLSSDTTFRVVFNEITKNAIQSAFENPRRINMHMVDAQQARRILDRIVGYQVSPLLWKKVAGGLSAGRVQTVAVRLIVEREEEIEAFEPEEYWRVRAIFCAEPKDRTSISEKWLQFINNLDEKGKGPTAKEKLEWLGDRGAFEGELVGWKGSKFKNAGQDIAIEAARAIGLEVAEITAEEDPKGKGVARNRVIVTGRMSASPPQLCIEELKTKRSNTKPYPPLITATLQQAASVQLRFSASRTMMIAQQLYEGINIPGEGQIGLITYMRTDSRNLSKDAIATTRDFIEKSYGKEYLPSKPNIYSSGKRAQEAHEAIRPTDPTRRPDDVSSSLSEEQYKLYSLIWRQTIACQMTPAEWENTEARIVSNTQDGDAEFKANGKRLVFDGFMRVAGIPKGKDQILPDLQEKQAVGLVDISTSQHFTQPPSRYTEAALVKALEAENIGRPSTYAPIIQTIQNRKYVEMLNRAFHPTDLGRVVTKKLVDNFTDLFEIGFTSNMEDRLDLIEDAKSSRVSVLREFYGPFKKQLAEASETMVHAKAETEKSDYKCPECDAEMEYRFGKNGRFLSCSRYPDCKAAQPIDREGRPVKATTTDIACPECSTPMITRRGRFGPFLSCSNYPDCKGTVKLDKKGFVQHPSPPPLEIEIECQKCGNPVMNLRRGKRGPWISCAKYPKCRGRLGWAGMEDSKKEELEATLEKHEAANPVEKVRKINGEVVGEEYKPVEIPGESEE